MLRVAVNLRSLYPGRVGGLEHAFRGMLDAMLRQFGDELQVTLLTHEACHHTFGNWRGRVERELARDPTPDQLRRALAGHDVLWCPLMFLDPIDPGIPAVACVPDLQHEHYPQLFAPEVLSLRLRDLRATIGYCKRVVVPSEFTRADIVRRYGVPAEHVVPIPHGWEADFDRPRDQRQIDRLRRQLQLPRRYVLFPANAWHHKNHIGLLAALACYRACHPRPLPAVFTGVAGVGGIDLRGEIAAAGLDDLVHCPGWRPQHEMPLLYDAAAMLVFPSLFEGFGIPVVEAMRRGVPVVAAARSALPEVAGDAALLVDPTNPRALADAMHAVLDDPRSTAQRVARGRQRVAAFAYERTAATMLDVLRLAASEPARPTAAVAAGARPKVFVVTPSLNQGRFLRQTIESVLAQDYPDIDYFVADGGSSDASVEILRSFGDRVRWVSQPDGGQAAAINRAWRASDADIVAWLNSDDTYLPGAVTAAVEHLRQHPDQSMVYGEAWYTDVAGRRTERYPTVSPFCRQTLARNCFICQPATFVRREVFRIIDLPDPALRYAMDYDLWIRLSQHFRIGHLDRALATSRMYPQNKTLAERDGVYREIMEVTRRHFGTTHREWLTGYAYHRIRQVLGRVHRCLPSPLRERIVATLCDRQAERLPAPPFEDGWVGPVTTVRVTPDDDGWVELSAESPQWPRSRPLVVRAFVDGAPVARQRVPARGAFKLRFRAAQRRLLPVAVTLRANGSFVGPGSRRVAFRVVTPSEAIR